MQSQVEGLLFYIGDSSAEKIRLCKILENMFETEPTEQELITEFKNNVSIDLFIDKKIQECYEIYRVIRAELGIEKVDVRETHLTGPLTSLRIISVIWTDAKRLNALQTYGEPKTELNKKS